MWDEETEKSWWRWGKGKWRPTSSLTPKQIWLAIGEMFILGSLFGYTLRGIIGGAGC